jgi:hypothetical protein
VKNSELSWQAAYAWGIGLLMLIFFHHNNYRGVVEDYENVVGAMLLSKFEHGYDENKRITGIKLRKGLKTIADDCIRMLCSLPYGHMNVLSVVS